MPLALVDNIYMSSKYRYRFAMYRKDDSQPTPRADGSHISPRAVEILEDIASINYETASYVFEMGQDHCSPATWRNVMARYNMGP